MALLDRAIAAKGRAGEAAEHPHDHRQQTLTNQGAQTDSVNYIEYPDRFPHRGGGTIQGFDGAQAWAQTRAACTTSPRGRRDARASLRRDTVALLLAAKDGTLAARLLPDVKDTVGHLTRTLEISGRDLNPVVLYIDRRPR